MEDDGSPTNSSVQLPQLRFRSGAVLAIRLVVTGVAVIVLAQRPSANITALVSVSWLFTMGLAAFAIVALRRFEKATLAERSLDVQSVLGGRSIYYKRMMSAELRHVKHAGTKTWELCIELRGGESDNLTVAVERPPGEDVAGFVRDLNARIANANNMAG